MRMSTRLFACFSCLAPAVAALGNGVRLPTFAFPEDGDSYFGKNVDALKSSLDQAVGQGCLDSWPLTQPTEIAIVFRRDRVVPETSDFYIQYQMEHVASDHVAGLWAFAEDQQYKNRLENALQIWEWSPRQLNFLNKNMQGTASGKLHYVPLWSTVGTVASHASCEEVLELPSCLAEPNVDVLFFGSMTESRKRLCSAVEAEVSQLQFAGVPLVSECASGVFGTAFECKICKAKVLFSDHSRPGAVLEVHRINPLLAIGKAVVGAKSTDDVLDSAYSGAMELTTSENIPKTIARLLRNSAARFKLEWNAYALAQKMKLEAQTHVCHALTSLASNVGEGALPLSKAWLQDLISETNKIYAQQ